MSAFVDLPAIMTFGKALPQDLARPGTPGESARAACIALPGCRCGITHQGDRETAR